MMSRLSDRVFERESVRLALQGAIFRALDAGLSESDIEDMVQQSIHDYVPDQEATTCTNCGKTFDSTPGEDSRARVSGPPICENCYGKED